MFTDQQFMIWTGSAILGLLVLILLARPLQKWFRFKYLMKYRRQLGWLTGAVSLAHFSYWVVFYLSLKTLLGLFPMWWFLSGFIAFLLILILTLTSNNWAVKKIGGKNWKRLHKLTYLIPLIVLWHVAFAIRGFNIDVILWAIVLVPLVAWRYDIGGLVLTLLLLSGFLYWFSTGLSVKEVIDESNIEFVCEKVIPESVSCGWPAYLADGTRIEQSGRTVGHN